MTDHRPAAPAWHQIVRLRGFDPVLRDVVGDVDEDLVELRPGVWEVGVRTIPVRFG